MHDLLGRIDAVGNGAHTRFVSRWLSTLGVIITSTILVVGGLVLFQTRKDTWQQATRSADNLVRALEQEIGRNIAAYDLTNQGAARTVILAGLDQTSPEIRQAALFDASMATRYLNSVLLTDVAGQVVADSTAFPPHDLSFADRDVFTVQREADRGFYIGRPQMSRIHPGTPILPMSRRIVAADGGFAGVVVSSVKLAYFQDLFRSLDIGRKGAISLFRTDGRLVARQPYKLEDVDRDISANTVFRRTGGDMAGQFVAVSTLDGVERLNTFRRIGSFPLTLTVSLSVEEVFAAWWRRAILLGSILLTLSGAVVMMCVMFAREMKRRTRAEHGLQDAARDLARIAATDGLTGLANRRRFDEALDQEWRRAGREETPLSLLLLDVDRFKLFNDQYGHQAGDECLRRVAAAVRGRAKRPADLAARYGGEELVVLLPGTDEAGAAVIAEQVRAAIAAIALPHEGNQSCGGVVTASIGTATAIVTRDGPMAGPEALVAAADAALYEAKYAGRNRVTAAGLAMPAGKATADEADRLRMLDAYRAAGAAEHTDGLDRIARLTAALLGTPIGCVSLVQQDSQLFAGRHGLDREQAQREGSFCEQTIRTSAPLVVPDALADPRFAGSSFVTGEDGIRFYAGAPLISPAGGQRLGALCVIDHVPRPALTAGQEEMLRDLAALVVDDMERRRTAHP